MLLRENISDLVKTWKGIREIIYITKTTSKVTNSIQINRKTLNEPKTIANEFNKQDFIN